MHIRRASQARIFTIVISIFALLAHAPNASASPRTWQPLVIKGSTAAKLCGLPIDKLELLAIHADKLEPIPFQVDQVNPGGAYALPMGPEPAASTHPNVLAADDEIVMMVSDLGARAPIDALLPTNVVELEVTD